MLERILKLYTMAMAEDVRDLLPHLFGPPGTGKSTVVAQAAKLLGVNLHVINLSRISPLELEGVQMPHNEGDEMKLRLLHATFWTQIKEGDIVLFDELLRAFPEVFNGLLDIWTARQVGGYQIPKSFFLGASNSTVSYDKALEDRLLHMPVEDIRKSKKAKRQLATIIVDALGLMPSMADHATMSTLIDLEVAPMYAILDQLGGKRVSAALTEGHSVRNLIAQAKLRDISSDHLKAMIDQNNRYAMADGKYQYVFLYEGTNAGAYEQHGRQLAGNPKLTETQARNLMLNLQLIELENQRQLLKGQVTDDDIFDDTSEDPF